MGKSIWGEEFTIEKPKKAEKKILEKINKPKVAKIVSSNQRKLENNKLSLDQRLQLIYAEVLRILGNRKDDTLVIRDKQGLHEYIDTSIINGIIAIDTETNNSKVPITCKLMGPCIYTPGLKQAYIPVNHVDRNTRELLPNQLTEDDIREEFQRLNEANVKVITQNGKFDYQVLKCTSNYIMPIFWDTLIGTKLMDENHPDAGLKTQFIEKIDPGQEHYDISSLFSAGEDADDTERKKKEIEYAIVDPEYFALYAASDPYMTYKLFEYQWEFFNKPENKDLLNLSLKIEMPFVSVVAELELSGMCVDLDYAERLSVKYHAQLDKVDAELLVEEAKIKDRIDAWRRTPDANVHPKSNKPDKDGNYKEQKSKSEQLTNPIKYSSPTQIAILLYDVLKAPVVNKKKPRSTSKEDLETIAEKLKLPICNKIVERKAITKLLSTYIDNIPKLAQENPDGRVRTHFNQYGAATGRLSSSKPLNFQNIPAHNKEVRLMFKAADGHRIVGGDFSAQEPRLTAFYSQDPAMIQAYVEGKDLYSVIASMSFGYPYEDCLEFYPEGTKIMYEGKEVICGHKTHTNPDGKKRRGEAKSILLGLLYGRGAKSVGEQIGKSKEEAQKIIDNFFKAFPLVRKWIDETMASVKTLGYVTDVAGRRRRLPDIFLPKYSIKDLNEYASDFNPILFARPHKVQNEDKITKYQKLLDKAKSWTEVNKIMNQAKNDNISILDNTGFISEAERQSVNSRVQGGAATLTKYALLYLSRDPRLKEINAKIINTVHDEILIECPEEYSKQAEEILTSDMVNSAKELVTNVPMKCDAYNVPCWYLDEYFTTVTKEFKKLLADNSPKEAFEKMCHIRQESTPTQLYEIIGGFLDYIPEGVDTSYKTL